MNVSIGLIIIIGIIDIIFILFTSIKHSLITQVFMRSGAAFLFYIGFTLIQKSVANIFKFKIDSNTNVDNDIRLNNPKVVAIIITTFFVEFFVLFVFSNYVSQLTIDILYFAVLISSGIIYALLCESPWYIPVFSTTVVLLVLSGIHSISFYLDPNINSQYGQKILEYTLINQAENFSKLPIDLIATWAAWRFTFDMRNIITIKKTA